MIDEKIARESQVHMRSRRPMDSRIDVIMRNIADGLVKAKRPALKDSSLRMVAIRNMQLNLLQN